MTDISTGDQDLMECDAKVFLSYSRKDRESAQRISDVLRQRKFGVFKDTDDILPTEEWKGRLEELIEEADTIVFLLSPHSATSEVCAWEVEYATSLNKRIAPLVIEDVDGKDIPPLLAKLNFIFCTQRDRFENAVDTLTQALRIDIDWVREHTRLAGLARRWIEAGSPARLLLRGQDIANAETWRDTHPPEAPQVTGEQAGFISDSRKAAGRRQRMWIGGSLGVTAMTAALAVFAYFQSVEANAQRQEAEVQRVAAEDNAAEAERQRGVAEENAAEADRQRGVAQDNAEEAERQRNVALRQLAGQSLLGGDRALAIETLQQIDPDAPQIPTLLAGLRAAEDVVIRNFAGLPRSVNGKLYLTAENAPPLPLDPFPAKYWAFNGASIMLASSTGAVRRVGYDGTILSDSADQPAHGLCLIRDTQIGVQLWGMYSPGYSACSARLLVTDVPSSGSDPVESRVFSACGQEEFTVGQGDTARDFTEHELVDSLTAICLTGEEADQSAFPFDTIPGLRAPLEIVDTSFPGNADESGLWVAGQDGLGLTAMHNARLTELGYEGSERETFGVALFEGEEGWVTLHDFTTPGMEALAAMSIWGGTGGEVHVICTGQPGQKPGCHAVHTFSGWGGATMDQDGDRLVFWGGPMSADGFEGGSSNFWLISGPGEVPVEVAEVNSYGEVLSVDFGPDGRLAAVTESALLVFDPSDGPVEAYSAPEGAGAVLWHEDGQMSLLAPEGLYTGTVDAGFRLTPLVAPVETTDPYDPVIHWLAQSEDEATLVLGYNDSVVLFDRGLKAPLSDAAVIGHPHRLPTSAQVDVGEDGSVTLSLSGAIYKRRGFDGSDTAARLDPQAPFR